MSLKNVLTIPTLEDNFSYLILNHGNVLLIDPGEYEIVYETLKEKDLHLNAILCTHHHMDHIDGVGKLKKMFSCRVYGPKDPRIKNLDQFVEEGEQVLENTSIQVLFTPGHTSSHLVYYFVEIGALFSGDLIFGAGCGRVFEGTYEQMFSSIQKVKNSLPDETKIYFGHEYTVKNLQFANSIEPENEAISRRLKDAIHKREKGEYTTPSTLKLEKQTNPFLRTNDENMRTCLQMPKEQELDIFIYLRKLRDNF